MAFARLKASGANGNKNEINLQKFRIPVQFEVSPISAKTKLDKPAAW